jgi:hypothetical protein
MATASGASTGVEGEITMAPPVQGPPDNRVGDQLVEEISVMLAYALEKGLELDPTVATIVGSNLATNNTSLASQSLSSLLALHSALTKAVAPATPGSLKATAPAPGWFGFLRRPPVIGWMVFAAVVCAFGFVIAISQKWPTVSWVSGAGLGAAFYGLFTAHDYVKQRTFDPRYNSVYMIRFVLGVIAGIILANLPIFDKDPNLKLGQGVIALLGGFSAEAVNQVLQRLVDILVATVKGSGSDIAKAQVEQVKTKAAAQLASAKQSVSQELSDVLTDPALPEPLRGRLKDIQSNLK